ncbi:MAG: hypothetical protein LBI54_04720 [Lachnospiraceae bacterium]|jgi:serpin B|nr:hypothetical protein [Lachnospiraceae bacterium]
MKTINKTKKIISLILCGLLVATVLAGCGNETTGEEDSPSLASPDVAYEPLGESEETPVGVTPASPVEDAATPTPKPRLESDSGVVTIPAAAAANFEAPQGNPSATAATVATGANDFAFRLSASLVDTANGGNFLCSPYSVWLPLAALVNATDAANKESLIAALGAAGISEDDINTAASRMLYDLTKQQMKEWAKEYGDEYSQDPLKIANAIFVGHDVTLKQDFADRFSQYYSGTAMTVDFSSQEATGLVNQWASDHTEGLITDIIDRFDPRTVAAIANAIYFSDRWDVEFDPDQTVEETFYVRPGHLGTSPTNEVSVPFMVRDGGIMDYYEDDKVQAVNLDFATGGGMTIILPGDGDATGLLKAMDSGYYDTIMDNAYQATGKLMLPRFSFESGIMDLKETLMGLGVPLFDEATAPLTGGLIEEDYDVWVGKAVQKAVIEVDEKGTTAAAVTLMIMMANGMMMPPAESFEMICDHPFVFVLYEETYDGGNQVLFTGVVNEP